MVSWRGVAACSPRAPSRSRPPIRRILNTSRYRRYLLADMARALAHALRRLQSRASERAYELTRRAAGCQDLPGAHGLPADRLMTRGRARGRHHRHRRVQWHRAIGTSEHQWQPRDSGPRTVGAATASRRSSSAASAAVPGPSARPIIKSTRRTMNVRYVRAARRGAPGAARNPLCGRAGRARFLF